MSFTLPDGGGDVGGQPRIVLWMALLVVASLAGDVTPSPPFWPAARFFPDDTNGHGGVEGYYSHRLGRHGGGAGCSEVVGEGVKSLVSSDLGGLVVRRRSLGGRSAGGKIRWEQAGHGRVDVAKVGLCFARGCLQRSGGQLPM